MTMQPRPASTRPQGAGSGAGCPSEEALLLQLAASPSQTDRQQLLAHLDVCPACRLLVATATRAMASDTGARITPAQAPSFRTFNVGERVLERYEIRRFIARGGMGEVYEAFDLLLGESVALKTLASTVLDDDRAAARFKGEARLARRVTHANVCRILEFGVHDRIVAGEVPESIPFLTMEFLRGETLADRIGRRGRFSPEEAMPLVRQIIAGLRAIHLAGIVHRDLKSENIFLVADARGGERAVLMDFGLARALDGSVRTTLPHLATARAGTIDCMAPEQIEGAPVGPAADIYALGVLLYELFTGRRPFVKVPPAERLVRPPPLPSAVVPALARTWDPIIARCLARQPEDRFPTVDYLLASLPAAFRGPAGDASTFTSKLVAIAVGAALVMGTAAVVVAALLAARVAF
jgi:eukaryotic-like serine/threonine-protein kinase